MALLTISLFVILVGLFLIVATHEINFLMAAFEVTSAFGTVGLSQGATGELNDFGRLIICIHREYNTPKDLFTLANAKTIEIDFLTVTLDLSKS